MKDETISHLVGSSTSEVASSHGQGEIGFVGLGHMETAMAANLIAAGHRVTAHVCRGENRLFEVRIPPLGKKSLIYHF